MTDMPAASSDYPFTDGDFAAIAELARTRFGLHLDGSKKQLVYSRLARRLRRLELATFGHYREMLMGPSGADEQREMLSALTTNVTQFFREAHHFDFLRGEVLPDLIARARAGGRVRLWSSGCSAGQEAYSLAMTVLDLCPDADKLDLRILATDIDPRILQHAVRARYSAAERAAIPRPLHAWLVDRGREGFSIGPAARRLVSFGELNLIEDWPMRGTFDAIMCRNVAIYFDAATQERLWRRFSERLSPGGHLMIGHSERVAGPAVDQLRSSGITTYTKVRAPSTTHPREDPSR